MKNTKKKITTNTIVKDFLKKNPEIRRTLEMFNMSEEIYQKAIESLSTKKLTISTKTTTAPNNNG
jgi:hypothetical protein